MSGNKKFIFLGIGLLIIAAIVIIALKGVNVSLLLRQHEEINLFVGKQVELKDMKAICKEVFGNKRFVVREVELFGNSVNISVESLTNDEKMNLAQKVNEKYGTSFTMENLEITENSNVRIRDMAMPYLKPVIISVVLILAYIYIRFIKNEPIKVLGRLCGLVLITEAIIASVVTIVRIPVEPTIIFVMATIAVLEVILFVNKEEKSLKV